MPTTIAFTLPDGLAPGELPSELLGLPTSRSDSRIVLESKRPLADVKLLADWALGRGLDLPDLDVRRPSLEDVYLQLTDSPQPGGAA